MHRLGVVLVLSASILSPHLAWADGDERVPIPVPAAPSTPAPPTAKQVEADRLFTEGRDLLAKKQPKEACAKFEEANKLDPLAAGTKLNLGLCYQELGKYHTALQWFREAQARAAETNLPDHKKAAEEHTVELAAKVPAITVEFSAPPPSDPQVTMDGEAIKASDFGHVEVDPGHHLIIVRATGKKIARQEFDIEEKTTKTVTISMVDGSSSVVLDPGKPRRYAAYGLVAVGAGAWVFTLVYGFGKQSDYNCQTGADPSTGNDATCKKNYITEPLDVDGHTVSAAERRAAKANKDVDDLRLYGTTAFVIGAVAIGAAAALYFTAPERRTVEQMAWTPVVGTDQLGFAVSGSF